MSTSTSTQDGAAPEKKAQLKDLYRDSRLSFRNFEEHQLRKELKSIAMDQCKEQLQTFGSCAEKNGIFVVFKCQGALKAMNECLGKHNSEEEFEKYKAKHRPDLLRTNVNNA